MTVQKTFSTFEQQVDWLQFQKHLIISDRQFALNALQRIGYFPLIGGYKHLFRIPLTKKYKDGTTFKEIVVLYEFDTALRELFFKYLLQIERNLRSLISYYFSEMYGESQSAYLDPRNFNDTRKTHKTVARLISTLRYASNSTDYAYINYSHKIMETFPYGYWSMY